MRKIKGYRRGYRIQITDGFYEVIQGNRVIYFGSCRKNSTIQEIVNKTIDLEREEREDATYQKRRFRNDVTSRIAERY